MGVMLSTEVALKGLALFDSHEPSYSISSKWSLSVESTLEISQIAFADDRIEDI